MKQYLDLMQHILDHGDTRGDRTGTGTIGIFGAQQRYDLRKGFPAVTTKKLAWKAVCGELLWFLEGSTDERRLAEITHGTRDGVATIWTANALAPSWKNNPHRSADEGDLGKVYGHQWRRWGPRLGPEIDQIKVLIEGIKKDPFGRRHIVTAWNPGELNQMALPPCHILVQFYVNSKHELSCQLYQRSADAPLGIPFNIASYALLTHMIAQVCGLRVGEFIHSIGDAHIYLNQVDKVKEQLSMSPLPLPDIWINPKITDIDAFTMNDFALLDYQHYSPIQFPFSV